jgi:hypothetical protein
VELSSGNELLFRYALGEDPGTKQVAVLTVDTPQGVAAGRRLALTMRSDHPMRVSVQLRDSVDPAPEDRWQRSVFVDTSSQERIVSFDDLTPVGPTRTPQPPLANIRNILFVIDRTNARAGASGRLWIRSATLQR